MNRPLAFGCLLVIAAVLLQLVPMPRGTVAALSPSGEALIGRQQVTEPGAAIESIVAPAASPNGFPHSLSINPRATRRGLAFLIAFALFLLGTSSALDRHETDRVVFGILVLSVVLALAGIAQKAGPNTKVYGLWQPYYSVVQPFGPFVNGNHFAGWMLMAIPLSIGYLCARVSRSLPSADTTWRDRLFWLSSPEANRLILIAVGILVMALALVMTLSRSGIICFTVILLMIGALVTRGRAGGLRYGLVALFLLSTAVISIGWGGMNAMVARFAAPTTLTLNGRVHIWQDTVRMIRDFRIVGTGLDTYATAMASYQTPVPGWDFSVAQAHSDYLQLAAEGGVLLVTPAAILMFVFIREARRRFRECSTGSADYWIRVGAVIGLIAIGLQEVAEFSLQIPGNAALFTVVCSLVVRPSNGERNGRDANV